MAIFENRTPDWISFPEALARVLAAAPALPARTQILLDSEGLAIAEEVRSTLTLPPSPTSHMDGYALRSGELADRRNASGTLPALFPVVGRSLPGSPWTSTPSAGCVIRIMTGAFLPPGMDTVVPIEETDRETGAEGTVKILFDRLPPVEEPLAGRHVRPPGEEARAGELLARPGDSLDYRLLAVLAAGGQGEVSVHPSPRVALLVTGSELVPAGDAAALHGGVKRADILTPALSSLVRRSGGTISTSLRVGDDVIALREALLDAARSADLVITTGGASVGEADLVKSALVDVGGEMDFWRIRMRPGSPVSLAHLPISSGRSIPVLGLPGNPVSAIVAFTLLGIPAVRALGGHARKHPRTIRGRVRSRLSGGPAHLARFPRVRLEPEGLGEWGVYEAGAQGSGVIRSIVLGDGIAILPEGAAAPEEGEFVEVILLPGAEWTARET